MSLVFILICHKKIQILDKYFLQLSYLIVQVSKKMYMEIGY